MNKYVRKIHRWLALPFVVLILTVFLARILRLALWRSERSKYSY